MNINTNSTMNAETALVKEHSEAQTMSESDDNTYVQKRLLPPLSTDSTSLREIQNILNNNRVCDGVAHSHVSMGEFSGTYSITYDQMENDDIWNLYSKFSMSNTDLSIGLAEKIQTVMPLLADIDIKTEYTNEQPYVVDSETGKIYSMDQVKQVISAYNTALQKYIPSLSDYQYKCVLLEKEPYTIFSNRKMYCKNGFHLHYPYLFLNAKDASGDFFTEVKAIVKQSKIFQSVGMENSADAIDANCFTNAWLLYGSVKAEGMKPYTASCVFDKNMNRFSIEDGLADYTLFNGYNKKIPLTPQTVRLNLPRILSILPMGRTDLYTRDIRKDLPSSRPLPLSRARPTRQNTTFERTKTDNYNTCKAIIPMISSERADDYLDWLRVGWGIYNSCGGTDEAFKIWTAFSEQSPKFEMSSCEREWAKMDRGDGRIKMGSLIHYAKTDNIDDYIEYKKDKMRNMMIRFDSGTHNSLAVLLHSMYGTEYVSYSNSPPIWHRYNEHSWADNGDGRDLRDYISKDLYDLFDDILTKYRLEIDNLEDDDASEKSLLGKIKEVIKIMISLKMRPFKQSLMAECSDVFRDESFKDKLNKNPYTVCFANGVMDLETGLFRSGRPDDYISTAMSINYTVYSPTDEAMLNIDRYLEKVFPDAELRTYFLDTCSDAFVGGNNKKQVIFWTGEGDNAKSVTQTIMEKMFGRLAVKFSTTLVTSKKTSIGAAAPELARAGNGVRWATLEEPDQDEKINMGILKLLSGNDSYFARDLFEKGRDTREILPMFKLTFICNKLPDFKYIDTAMRNRMRVIPFESKFIRQDGGDIVCPDTYEEQMQKKMFPMDCEFSKKIGSMLEPFAYYLLEHRKRIGNRNEPTKVRLATDSYYMKNDLYFLFLNCTVKKEDSQDKNADFGVRGQQLYEEFKSWMKEEYGSNKVIPCRNEAMSEFEKKLGCLNPFNRWGNYNMLNQVQVQSSNQTGVYKC